MPKFFKLSDIRIKSLTIEILRGAPWMKSSIKDFFKVIINRNYGKKFASDLHLL